MGHVSTPESVAASPHEGTRAVLAAMAANVSIAVMKLLAWLLTGAASLLAEAIHSLADSVNQVLLLAGTKASKRKPTALHPFGFGHERFLSAFLVAIILFTMGGLFALVESYRKFSSVRAGHPDDLVESRWWWVAILVILGAMAAEGLSLRTGVHESNQVRLPGQSWVAFIRETRSPELPVILMEDTAALTGLVFALVGVGMTKATGSGYWDVAGSAAIGLLLIAVAVILAVKTQSLLVGASAAPEEVARIEAAIAGTPGVERVIHLRTIHLGPEDVMVAAKVAVPRARSADDIARTIDDAEGRIRAGSPMVGLIYLEPDIDRGPTPPLPVDEEQPE